MNLTDPQKAAVTKWIADGLKLAEIQTRLAKEFGARLTYMEVRFLVDDLKLVPKDPTPPVEPKTPLTPAPSATKPAAAAASPGPEDLPGPGPEPEPAIPAAPAPAGDVALTVDTVTRPGTLVSGSVKFSDGVKAAWYLDQYGRLGVVAEKKGYKPSQADVQKFQAALDAEMAKLGY
jgi:hypothetical protein